MIDELLPGATLYYNSKLRLLIDLYLLYNNHTKKLREIMALPADTSALNVTEHKQNMDY